MAALSLEQAMPGTRKHWVQTDFADKNKIGVQVLKSEVNHEYSRIQ
jgi:hypothetical protein